MTKYPIHGYLNVGMSLIPPGEEYDDLRKDLKTSKEIVDEAFKVDSSLVSYQKIINLLTHTKMNISPVFTEVKQE